MSSVALSKFLYVPYIPFKCISNSCQVSSFTATENNNCLSTWRRFIYSANICEFVFVLRHIFPEHLQVFICMQCMCVSKVGHFCYCSSKISTEINSSQQGTHDFFSPTFLKTGFSKATRNREQSNSERKMYTVLACLWSNTFEDLCLLSLIWYSVSVGCKKTLIFEPQHVWGTVEMFCKGEIIHLSQRRLITNEHLYLIQICNTQMCNMVTYLCVVNVNVCKNRYICIFCALFF